MQAQISTPRTHPIHTLIAIAKIRIPSTPHRAPAEHWALQRCGCVSATDLSQRLVPASRMRVALGTPLGKIGARSAASQSASAPRNPFPARCAAPRLLTRCAGPVAVRGRARASRSAVAFAVFPMYRIVAPNVHREHCVFICGDMPAGRSFTRCAITGRCLCASTAAVGGTRARSGQWLVEP